MPQGSLVALLALACLAGGAGIVGQARGQQLTVVRQAEQEDASAVPEGASPEQPAAAPESAPEPVRYVVHVDGAVLAPGVVELEGDDLRVYDAVRAAGGLADDADTTQVNLAEPLRDGSKIHISREGEVSDGASAAAAAGQHETAGATGGGGGTALVNINTATSEELQSLSGVGEATAAAIIRERESNGPFAAPEDLMRVSGIGEKKFERVRHDICV